ncbi:bifunctional 2-polyprenyl-6-hydroxyphenol methylase/3-demethylubiquinol 3-O-methyltransferase UbiG [Pontibacter sp. HSC-36F09]|uniref:class I SAM-dependent methyltransferase n=1 Tax=Pontibacter sp. HSC-36F09 TaxID=2910966 RepID=UPI00209CE0FE|nr:class I SAM-dependent methyltransferase [Pontibacter sp. HSC-36F09]MCP2044172.1 2-polyprenyl-3-methyl-5-hydroxy-6-metoxy-1,4-benzoquinol methylase [Pontibacter sp. HSC-36F09]
MFHIPLASLRAQFGDIDIYLFDQLLKGRIQKGMQLLDAGCGAGRNIAYLMQAGVQVYGADISAEAIEKVRKLATEMAPTLPSKNFVVADLDELPFADEKFDVVLCSAVLHFARSEEHFKGIVQELWRTIKPGGMLFARFSTTIGLEGKLQQMEGRFYRMAHGPVWFLADENLVIAMERELGAERLEPLKTVLVEQDRAMTTWVVRKAV